MKKKALYIILSALIVVFPAIAQDESIYEELLKEVVDVEDPVYKPVVGGGIGMMGFIGDVKNNNGSMLFNKPAYKINVSTFVARKSGLRANFTFLTGTISASERSYSNQARNINFESTINSFGVNLEYGFGDLTADRKVMPFISLGAEVFQFDSKIDNTFSATDRDVAAGAINAFGNPARDGDPIHYHYWSDGTIRNLPEVEGNIFRSRIVQRDYIVDADLDKANNSWYSSDDHKSSQSIVAIPLELGLDFTISDRLMVRLGTSLHYTLTDYLDYLSPDNVVGLKANRLHDIFTYTYVTVHLDLFSEAKSYELQKFVADFDDFDYTFLEDQDGDYVWDHVDECPDTPMNVPVDSVGCPFDDDNDGVPNYLDKEPDTPPGAFVNHDGVQMSDDELIALLSQENAVARKDVDLYIRKIDDITYSKYYGISNLEIPPKFKVADNDGDGYISFDEVLDMIDKFFEFESTFSTEDIYELNEFFFAQ
jgi:hypothetical protein